MKKFVIAVVLASSSWPASASDWWMVGFPSGTKLHHQAFFVDHASISDVGGFRRVWISMVNEAPIEGVRSLRSYLQFDCAQSRWLTLQNSTVLSTGRRSGHGSYTEWQFVMPDSPMNMIAKDVCETAFFRTIRLKDETPEAFAPSAFSASNSLKK
jgi:hypothetical protein